MIYVDTNILLRYILRDNPELSPRAKSILMENECYVVPEVIPEVVYVLQKVYGYARQDVAAAVMQLLQLIVLDNRQIVQYALKCYAETNFDYVDCLLAAHSRLRVVSVQTFDRNLAHYMNR